MEPLVGVGLVMALLFGAARLAARNKNGLPVFTTAFGMKAAARRLELIERLPLTSTHSLHLVRFEAQTYLVATFPHGASLTATSNPGSFSSVLVDTLPEQLLTRDTVE